MHLLTLLFFPTDFALHVRLADVLSSGTRGCQRFHTIQHGFAEKAPKNPRKSRDHEQQSRAVDAQDVN